MDSVTHTQHGAGAMQTLLRPSMRACGDGACRLSTRPSTRPRHRTVLARSTSLKTVAVARPTARASVAARPPAMWVASCLELRRARPGARAAQTTPPWSARGCEPCPRCAHRSGCGARPLQGQTCGRSAGKARAPYLRPAARPARWRLAAGPSGAHDREGSARGGGERRHEGHGARRAAARHVKRQPRTGVHPERPGVRTRIP